jgi:hypothetical protein
MPNGILESFYRLYDSNIKDQIKLTATEEWGGEYNALSNLLNWDSCLSCRFFSKAVINPFLQIEFVDTFVKVNRYSLETHVDGAVSHPTKWILYGSKDCNEWTIIDSRETQELAGYNRKKFFPIHYKGNIRCIKLVQENNTFQYLHYNNTLAIRRIDFYNTIHDITYNNKSSFLESVKISLMILTSEFN